MSQSLGEGLYVRTLRALRILRSEDFGAFGHMTSFLGRLRRKNGVCVVVFNRFLSANCTYKTQNFLTRLPARETSY